MIKQKKSQTKKSFRNINPFIITSGKFKDGKITNRRHADWAENVFISDNQDKETIGNSFDLSKVSFLIILLLSGLGLLLGRSAWLQVVRGDYYHDMAEGNRIRIEKIKPRRGVIYDQNKISLVRNQANFMLYVVPADMPNDQDKLNSIENRIRSILGEDIASKIIKAMQSVSLKSLQAYQPIFITDNIKYEKAILLNLEAKDWPGISLEDRSRREYLFMGTSTIKQLDEKSQYNLFSLSHLMGYTGKINQAELQKFGNEYGPLDYIGKMGVEYFWETELRGLNGKKQIEVDALGNEKKIIGENLAIDGHNLLLSLDVKLQLKLEAVLHKYLDKLKLQRASAIALDPRNGEIIAMVSLPAYDNNLFAQGISQADYSALISHIDRPLVNRSISGQYPSGSTIKPVMAIAALEEGVINEYTHFYSTGGIRIGQWFFPDWKIGGHGRTNVRKAIAESVNTFFYYIGGGYQDFQGLGVDRIVKYYQLFGLGSQLGVDLAGEASGLIPSKQWKKEVKHEPWYVGDTYHMSIGQGDVLVTPLQVAVFTAVFANNGKLYRPHLVRSILDNNDQLISDTDVTPIRENFLDDYNVQVVKEGMRQTVTAGSARSMQSAPVAIAGKTGTAQWSSIKNNHAWFTGFAPFDKPKLVITVLVEEGGEGSSVAVPIANEVLSWYFGEYKKNN